MFADPEFWVAVGLFGFIAVLLYLKVFSKIGVALDNRAAEIRKQLEDARRLREEAEAILKDYKRKQRDAEREVEDIIAQAKRDAEAYARETRVAFEEMLKRRAKLAEDKIARAEAQVIDEVRNRSVDIAVNAAQQIIKAQLTGAGANAFVEDGIKAVGAKLNS
jgi:F-type H+-transporting ATPase subunit b